MSTANQTSTDYRAALRSLGYIVRYNQMTREVEANGETYNDIIDARIHAEMNDLGRRNRRLISDIILVEAEDNAYHPLREQLEKLAPWDGTPRIAALSTYLKPENPALAAVLLRKWMIAGVSKIYRETQNMILVIQGEQGTGKSCFAKWIASLFPPRYFTADKLDPRNKDDQIKATRTAVWEIGELETTTTRADMGDLKRFVTQDAFTVRPPYARYDVRIPVTASLIGTVNPTGGFLVDPSGNRRFWMIKSNGIDFSYRNAFNVGDLWAEAYAAFKAGEDFTLTAEEAAANEREQDAAEIVDLVAEAIKEHFEIDPAHPEWLTPCNKVREVLQREGVSPAELKDRRLGQSARRLGLVAKTVRTKDKVCKCYLGVRERESIYPVDRYDN
jgi:predicted P-loop ATPase